MPFRVTRGSKILGALTDPKRKTNQTIPGHFEVKGCRKRTNDALKGFQKSTNGYPGEFVPDVLQTCIVRKVHLIDG